MQGKYTHTHYPITEYSLRITDITLRPYFTPVCFTSFFALTPSASLVDFQLDAQNSHLVIYNTFIKILYMFRALPCSSSEGLRRNCIYAASGIVTVCR
jgi:hypothetical protein